MKHDQHAQIAQIKKKVSVDALIKHVVMSTWINYDWMDI